MRYPASCWYRLVSSLIVSEQVDKVDNILDTEWTWQEFYRDRVGEEWETEYASRYVRINPDLKQPPPSLDAKQSLDGLQEKVSNLLRKPTLARKINEVANTLVASTFYFQKDNSQMFSDNQSRSFVCRGESRLFQREKLMR